MWTLTNQQRLGLRAAAAAGQLWSPRLYVSGQWAPHQYPGTGLSSGPRPDPLPAPRMDSVAAYVAAFKAAGFDFIKLYSESQEMVDSVTARRGGSGFRWAGM